MDTLTDILAVTEVRGSVAATVVAGEPWGLGLSAVPGAAFHAVTAGTAWLMADGHMPRQLLPGDAVLLPGGVPHQLASSEHTPIRPFDHVRAEAALADGVELVLGSPPTTTRILCASYRHDSAAILATFDVLPDIVHIPALHAQPSLRSSLNLLDEELSHPAPGRRAVLDHIVNVLLIQVLRSWIAGCDDGTRSPSWLRGLADPITRAALAELHRDPSRPWTTDELARRAGVSRATLARRFTSEIGHPPGDYLATWRMELAAYQLRNSNEPVGVVSRSVGYTSEYAFNRAFARRHGLPPGRYRATYRHTS